MGPIGSRRTSGGASLSALLRLGSARRVVGHRTGVGALHSHPHTQITYVVSGKFEFEIDGEKHVVKAGDTMLKRDGIVHGCVCLEPGILLDTFTPYREDFVQD
ncbi:MAG: cupin domain-containing protein [Denitrobacterium detoxificans]|nr:cupin domain-containing protein [Denitrobacterium detoxificans]